MRETTIQIGDRVEGCYEGQAYTGTVYHTRDFDTRRMVYVEFDAAAVSHGVLIKKAAFPWNPASRWLGPEDHVRPLGWELVPLTEAEIAENERILRGFEEECRVAEAAKTQVVSTEPAAPLPPRFQSIPGEDHDTYMRRWLAWKGWCQEQVREAGRPVWQWCGSEGAEEIAPGEWRCGRHRANGEAPPL
jgi:hypothetical protein